uniref:Chemotaxis protein CheX n=1 Tax=uncultured bacterium contig00010 TaxID=1181502 RepID=A0A806KAG5_9BACT|nr:chemotaxis protein CheX [uncultured bacterium contig00010]
MTVELTTYVEPFVEVTVNTFKEFIGVEVSPRHPHFLDPDKGLEWDISAVIGLSGVVRGAVIVSMKNALALKLTSILTGQEYTEIDVDVMDAIGEINNIIAGNIKPKIPNGDKIVISIPTIIRGKEHSIAWPSKQTRILCIPHKAFENDIFHLMVAIDLENEK